jgi:hypothetical protein
MSKAISSVFRVLRHEDQAEFNTLKQRIAVEHLPRNEHEKFLVEQMAQARWRIARVDRLEKLAYDHILSGRELSESNDPDARIITSLSKNGRDPFAALARHRAAAERAYYQAHEELTSNRSDRLALPIGDMAHRA